MDINIDRLNKNDYIGRIKTKKISQKVISINSLMISIVLCVNFISIILSSNSIIHDRSINIIITSSVMISYVVTFCSGIENFKINRQSLLFNIYILIIFMVSLLTLGVNPTTKRYLTEYMAYGFSIFLITIVPFSPVKILEYTMLISVMFLINPYKNLEHMSITVSNYSRISMGASYAILPGVVSAIIHFFFVQKANILKKIVGYISNFILLSILITKASRGTVLAIVVLLTLILYIKFVNKRVRDKKILNIVIFIVFMILVFIIIFKLDLVLMFMYNFFNKIGLESAAIIKTYNMVVTDGLSGILNGRDVIYNQAIDLFYKSPILGNGIGAYGEIYGMYQHNIFLQLINEGGLILLIPLLIIILNCITLLRKPWGEDMYYDEGRYVLLLTFIISIPRLMFSSYLWQQQSFWLMICIYFAIKKYSKTL